MISLKFAPALLFVITSFFSLPDCQAQSIVGKWHRTFTKIFVTDKTTGKQVPASPEAQKTFNEQASAYHETLELKADNTYISTVSAGADEKPRIHNGTYTLSGKDLDMKIPLVHNEKTTISIQSIDSKVMVWNLLFMGKLTEITYTRL